MVHLANSRVSVDILLAPGARIYVKPGGSTVEGPQKVHAKHPKETYTRPPPDPRPNYKSVGFRRLFAVSIRVRPTGHWRELLERAGSRSLSARAPSVSLARACGAYVRLGTRTDDAWISVQNGVLEPTNTPFLIGGSATRVVRAHFATFLASSWASCK